MLRRLSWHTCNSDFIFIMSKQIHIQKKKTNNPISSNSHPSATESKAIHSLKRFKSISHRMAEKSPKKLKYN